jgi:hypothetical protein
MIRRFFAPDNQVANVSAVCIGLLGLAVMAGWILRLPTLVQLLPNTPPLVFNGALGLVVAAVGLSPGRPEWRSSCSAA